MEDVKRRNFIDLIGLRGLFDILTGKTLESDTENFSESKIETYGVDPEVEKELKKSLKERIPAIIKRLTGDNGNKRKFIEEVDPVIKKYGELGPNNRIQEQGEKMQKMEDEKRKKIKENGGKEIVD